MQQDELHQLLTEFTAERVALIRAARGGARVVSHYDFNNTYQYVIAREETHLAWLQTALAEFGVALPPAASDAARARGAEERPRTRAAAASSDILEDDARHCAFVERWRPKRGRDDARAASHDAGRRAG